MPSKYALPDFLREVCTPEQYQSWLRGKAKAHCLRDRNRGNAGATQESYRVAIHAAVTASGGLDAYTGLPLRWELVGTYDNEVSQARGRAYKHELGDLPTVDHVGDGLSAPDFVICSWRINDAKHDLPYEQFVKVCREVLAHHEKRGG